MGDDDEDADEVLLHIETADGNAESHGRPVEAQLCSPRLWDDTGSPVQALEEGSVGNSSEPLVSNIGRRWCKYTRPDSGAHWWWTDDTAYFFEETPAPWKIYQDYTQRHYWWNDETREWFYTTKS
jgi:hypothetical protein